VQHVTERELSKEMFEFSNEFVSNLPRVDGFILKGKSPSCGTKEVKIYKSTQKGSASVKGKGLFGEIVMEKFPGLAIEDDGRVKNYNIRQHFLTKLYLMKNFRVIKEFILGTIEQYRESKVPFSVPLYVIKSNAIRFEEKNLINQTFFEPYPLELDNVTDSGKGLDK